MNKKQQVPLIFTSNNNNNTSLLRVKIKWSKIWFTFKVVILLQWSGYILKHKTKTKKKVICAKTKVK